MQRSGSLRFALLAVATLGMAAVIACATKEDEASPASYGVLELQASALQVVNNGTTVDLAMIASEPDGSHGTGDVTLKVASGSLGGGATTQTVTLANGQATTTYKCSDATCVGLQRITATWKDAVASVKVNVVAPGGTTPDAGGGGGGTPDAGGVDAGPIIGTDNTLLTVAVSKDPLYGKSGDYSDVTATLGTAVDGGIQPMQNVDVEFRTDLGGLTPPAADAGVPASSYTAKTNAQGKVVARFHENGTLGTATITAKHASGAEAQAQINVRQVSQLSWASTTCGGSDCSIMGVKGFGFNEQALVTFKIVDGLNVPTPGVRVTFTVNNPPKNTTWTADGITDEAGLVATTVSAGEYIGSFTVVAQAGELRAESLTIGIRGVVPSNHALILQCDKINLPAYINNQPGPAPLYTSCNVKLADRYNNAIGTGATVNFLPEAGTIEPSRATKAFEPNGDNSKEGEADTAFSTNSANLPADVAPFLAEDFYPYPRTAEPSNPVKHPTTGAVITTNNPRDGLVTLIAYVRGQEYFADANQNGQWNAGEHFIDQGEPFVDSNDNGIWEAGETYIDVNDNGIYDYPNGTWDRETTIWTEAHILYTGEPAATTPMRTFLRADPTGDFKSRPCTGLSSDAGTVVVGGLGRGASESLDISFADSNLNRVSSDFTLTLSKTGDHGSVTYYGNIQDDLYGFGLERGLFKVTRAAAPNQSQITAVSACSAGDRCEWRTYFTGWGMGDVGTVVLDGAEPSTEPKCGPSTIRATACFGGHCWMVAEGGNIE